MGSSRSAGAADCPLHPTHDHLAKRADPSRLPDRARRDEALRPEIRRVFEANWRGSMASARSGGSSSGRASVWHFERWQG
jgi:hypothetical protein